MTCYIVTFQTNSEASRQKVRERLKTYSNYCPIHDYCWAILTDQKATQVRDYVGEIMAPNERIFVIRSGQEAAWLNAYGEENTEWLKKNL